MKPDKLIQIRDATHFSQFDTVVQWHLFAVVRAWWSFKTSLYKLLQVAYHDIKLFLKFLLSEQTPIKDFLLINVKNDVKLIVYSTEHQFDYHTKEIYLVPFACCEPRARFALHLVKIWISTTLPSSNCAVLHNQHWQLLVTTWNWHSFVIKCLVLSLNGPWWQYGETVWQWMDFLSHLLILTLLLRWLCLCS